MHGCGTNQIEVVAIVFHPTLLVALGSCPGEVTVGTHVQDGLSSSLASLHHHTLQASAPGRTIDLPRA